MKRITFKISKLEHSKLKMIVLKKNTKINKLIIEYISSLIIECKSTKGELIRGIFISKDEKYSESDDLVTISIEIDSNLHKGIKMLCTEYDRKVKHFMRGIILRIIKENDVEKKFYVCKNLLDGIEKSAIAVAYTKEQALDMIHEAAIKDGFMFRKDEVKLEIVDGVMLID